MVPGVVFPIHQDLAHILGRRGFDSDDFNVLDSFGIPDFQIPGFPDSWISRFPDFQIQGCQPEIARAFSAVAPLQLRGGSAVALDPKVGEIKGTREIL